MPISVGIWAREGLAMSTWPQQATDSPSGRGQGGLGALRQAIRTIEGFSSEDGEGRAVTLGIPTIDAALGGGLACGALARNRGSARGRDRCRHGLRADARGTRRKIAAIANRTPSPPRGEGWGEGSPTERPEPPHPRALRSLDLSPLGRGERVSALRAASSGSPRTWRSPRAARLTVPASTPSALRPSG